MNQETSEKLYTLIAKDSTWFAKVSESEILALLQEKAIEQKENKSNTYQTLYTDKELKLHVKTREKGCCYYCKNKGNVLHWLVPKDGGGLETTVNLLYTCKECREEKKRAYLENQEEYLTEVQAIKKRNADYFQEEQGVLCLNCGETKKEEAFKFIDPTGELAYCHDCYEINQLNTYFLYNEQDQFEGTKTREEIQECWEDGRIEYSRKRCSFR